MRTYEITVKRGDECIAFERRELEHEGDAHVRLIDLFTQTGLGIFNDDQTVTVNVERVDA